MENKNLYTAIAALFAVALILSANVLSNGIKYKYVADETISTTGLSEKEFTSDLALWSANFSRKSLSKQEGFAMLKKDAQTIKQYLISKGFAESEIALTSISTSEDNTYYTEVSNGISREKQQFNGYILSQSIEIESKKIDLVESSAREITELINESIEINSNQPSYYYSKLEDLKLALISEATENATTRAKNIAEKSGSSLGNLKNAITGVFQITGKNSSEEYSWGGVYNTSDRQKKASITVKLKFGID